MNLTSFTAKKKLEITGIGVGLPKTRIQSSELDRQYNLPLGTIEKTSGVFERPLASGSETQIKLAGEAAMEAIENAKIAKNDIDLVLFAAAVGHQPIPSTAPLLKRQIGLQRPIPAYDINATCLSALVAIDHAAMAITTGRAKTVLVVASEIASSALPWKSDPGTAGLFGDGAGAIILTDGGQPENEGYHLGSFQMETYPEGYEACQLRAGGTALSPHKDIKAFADGSEFEMDGRQLYKVSAGIVPTFVESVLNAHGWKHKDVDLVIPHQASPHALVHIVKRCGFSRAQVFDHVRHMGNLVSASILVALYQARLEGRLRPGARLLLVGTSAGVSLGAMTLTVSIKQEKREL